MLEAVLERDDIGIHLGSEVVFAGQAWPGFVHTIEHPDGLVLVDTGMIDSTPELDAEWSPTPHPLDPELVRRVAVVINTHLHFDHAGNNALFEGVPIYVQRAHYEQALGHPAYPNETWNLPGLRYELLDGETELFPGVELLLTPGHAPAHQSLLLTLTSGRRVLLCGDAILSQANIDHDNWETQADPVEARRSARRLIELAAEHDALMIFGHDPVQMHELTYAPGAYR